MTNREEWRVQQEFASTVDIRKGPIPFIRPTVSGAYLCSAGVFFLPGSVLQYGCSSKSLLLWLSARLIPRPNSFFSNLSMLVGVVLCLGFFPVFLDLFQGQDAILML